MTVGKAWATSPIENMLLFSNNPIPFLSQAQNLDEVPSLYMTLDTMIVSLAHEIILSLHLTLASFFNSRRSDINYGYIVPFATNGGWRLAQQFPLFDGDNEGHQGLISDIDRWLKRE